MNKKILVPLGQYDRGGEMIPYIEKVARVMAKQLMVPLRSDGSAQDILFLVTPIIESGLKAKLLQVLAALSRYVRGDRSPQLEESYIPRKSREDESRLEFQQFLYW